MKELSVIIFESGISLGVLYCFYLLFIKGNTFFSLNRWFLLITLLTSLLISFIDLSLIPQQVNSVNQFVFTESFSGFSDTILLSGSKGIANTGSFPYLFVIYLAGMVYFLIRLIKNIHLSIKKIKAYEINKKEKVNYIISEQIRSPFSFLNFIFINQKDLKNTDVVNHELGHVRMKHTIDLILIELFIVFQWFNPFIHLVKREMKELHEYQADEYAIQRTSDSRSYQLRIIDQIESNLMLRLSSYFNLSLTTKRIKMMNKIRTKNRSLFKYMLVAPVVGALMMLFSFNNSIGKAYIINYFEDTVNVRESTVPSICPIKKGDYNRIAAKFGMRTHPISKIKKMHNGIDFSAEKGTEIIATADGKVREAKLVGGYGKRIIVDHNESISTLYAHMDGFNVSAGDEVKKGDVIGWVGNTGMSVAPHLHYEVMVNGENKDPENYFTE